MSDRGPRFRTSVAVVIVLAWAALAAAMAVWVERPDEAGVDGRALYLPKEFESQAAQLALRDAFPESYRSSTAVVVVHRPGGLTREDLGVRLRRLVGWFQAPPDDAAPPRVRQDLAEAPLVSPLTDPHLASRLRSSSGETALVLVGMPDIFNAQRTQEVVRLIHRLADRLDRDGLGVEVTGSAGFYENYDAASEESLHRSTLVTVLLVVAVLLLVYRSPVAMLVPLVTIAVAVHVATRLLLVLQPWGFVAGPVIEVFIVVLLFGSGTDYCLFVFARHKEELLSGEEAGGRAALESAMGRAWRGTAGALLAAALTTMTGLSLISLAVFRAFQKAGPSAAVGVDYNIYVCARIREERRRLPLGQAVRTALARTGGIVSACGVIVAGTFASMIAGTLSLMVQLGFALALGILVDTFLVRPLLVPAAALMLSRAAERRAARKAAR